MKKALSFLLSITVILASVGVMPVGSFASYAKQKATEDWLEFAEKLNSSTDEKEDYFLPVIVDGDTASQGNTKIDTLTLNDETLVSVDDMKLSKKAKKDIDTKSKNEEDFAALEDIADAINAQVDNNGDITALVKPFQTKRLTVYSSNVPKTGETERITSPDGAVVLFYDSEETTEKAYALLKSDKRVKKVFGDNVYQSSELTADDFRSNEQKSWGASYVNSYISSEYITSKSITKEVIVGIVDTGISLNHSFLKDRISDKSKSFVKSEETADDLEGHGSHVAGIIKDNTPDNVKLLAAKGLDKDGYGDDYELANAIRYCVDEGASVINMSWGGYAYWTESVLKNAISYAYNNGVTLCAAAGNEDDDTKYYYPANSNYCITVAATNQYGSPSYFSNYGSAVDIAAPGSNITSSVRSGFMVYSGTSMATPFVSAAAAVDIIVNEHNTPSAIKSALKKAVTPIVNNKGRNYGTGIISFTKLLKEEISAPAIFSVKSGYYKDVFYLGINCTSDSAKIIYTTDGSVPSLTNGSEYISPILISENITIKARAFESGKLPSVITRANYYFNGLESEDNFTIDNGIITSYLGSMAALIVPDVIQGQTVIGVGANVFKNKSVVSVQLPDTVTFIGNRAFYGCTSLQSVIARGVTTIDDFAFYVSSSSEKLEYIEFSPLLSVSQGAFYNRHLINEDMLDISNLTEIPYQAFYNCGFTHLECEENLTCVEGYGFYGNSIVGLNAPLLTEVGNYAFANNKLSVVNADNLKKAGNNAFMGNKELKSVSFAHLIEVGNAVFKECGIEKATLPTLQKVGSNLFMNCVKLSEYDGPIMNYVPQGFFNGCSSLKEIPECFKYATNINGEAFKNCSSLETIAFPYATRIGKDAISGCNNVRELNLDSVTYFNSQSGFNSPYITTLVLPEVVTFIGFTDNDYVKELRLPKAVSDYNSTTLMTVRNCTALETFYAPYLTEITSSGMFGNCPKLKKLVIYSATKLDYNVFTANNWSNYINPKAIEEIITPNAVISGYRPLNNLKIIDVSAAKSIRRYNQSASFTTSDESLKYLIAPNVETGTIGYIPENSPMKELNLPSLVNVTLTEKFYANVHMPNITKLSKLYFDGGMIVLPKAIDKINVGNGETFYSANENITVELVNDEIKYNRISEPLFIENLPASITLSENNPSIEIHVMAPDPVYSWYYSEDGSNYEKLAQASRYNLLPEKSGYYYCSVYDRDSEKTLVSDVCRVNCPYETVSVDFNFENAVNVFVGDILVEGITNETISVPKNTNIRVLFNGIDDNILFEGEQYYIYESMDNGFVLNVTKNSSVVPAGHTETLIDIGKADVSFSSLKYNGKPQKPEVTVSYEGETLTEGVDYEIPVLSSGTSARYYYDYEYHKYNYPAIIRGIGRFTGTVNKYYNISTASINDCSIEIEPQMVYNGIAQKPRVHVFLNDNEVPSYDYNVNYSNNIDVGTGRVTISGDEDITGSKTLTFEIVPELDSFRIIAPDCAYTGEQIEPRIIVNNSYITLAEDVDYTVEYGENINKGVGTFTIKGLNRFEGQEVNGTFKIGTSLVGATILTEYENYEFTGEKIEPNVTVTFENSVLEQGKDYVVSFNSNINIGKGRITVTGIGEYIGSVYGYFDIVSRAAQEHHHSPSEPKKENIKAATCTVNGSYDEVIYCLVCSEELERQTKEIIAPGHTPGKATRENVLPATCTANGSYDEIVKCTVCSKELSRERKTLKKLEHAPKAAVKENIVPATFSKKGSYDSVVYCLVCKRELSRVKKTVAKLGSPSLSKVAAGKKSFKATWKSVASIGGYQIQYSTSSSFKSGNKTVTVSGYKSTSITVKNLKAKKKYYVRIRAYKTINGKKYYSAWSSKKTVTTKK